MIEWNPNYLSVEEILSQPDGSTVNIIGDIFTPGAKNEDVLLVALEIAALMPCVTFVAVTDHLERATRLIAGDEEITMCRVWGGTVKECTTDCLNWLMRHTEIQLSPEIREALNLRTGKQYTWPLENFKVNGREASEVV